MSHTTTQTSTQRRDGGAGDTRSHRSDPISGPLHASHTVPAQGSLAGVSPAAPGLSAATKGSPRGPCEGGGAAAGAGGP